MDTDDTAEAWTFTPWHSTASLFSPSRAGLICSNLEHLPHGSCPKPSRRLTLRAGVPQMGVVTCTWVPLPWATSQAAAWHITLF